MKERKPMLGLIAEAVDFPKELLPGMPLIEITGNERVMIENHGGVSEYTGACIRVRVSFGTVCICGRNLRISRMQHKQLIIVGILDGLTFEQGAKK